MARQKSVSKYLKEKRMTAKFSQSELAKELKLHPQLVSNWERGVCAPPERHLRKLCNLLALNKNEFLEILMSEVELHYRTLLQASRSNRRK